MLKFLLGLGALVLAWGFGSEGAKAQAPVVSCIGNVTPNSGANCTGWTMFLANGLSTTVKTVKSTGGQVGMLQCYNPNSSQVYVQFFNLSASGVTLGTSVPLISVPIGPTATGGFALAGPGTSFNVGISIAATTTATGSTAPATAPDCNVAFN